MPKQPNLEPTPPEQTNSHAIVEKVLDAVCTKAENPDLRWFLELSVGRVLAKHIADGMNIEADHKATIAHICDWLKASLINEEHWTTKLDGEGRPKKLMKFGFMKFGSLEQIAKEANKAMLKAAMKLATVKIVEGDEELYETLNDGFHLVRLLTPAALDRESAEMQHCIGNGAYDHDLEDPDVKFLSLRDGFGKAHATIEMEDQTILQVQGKQNKRLSKNYVKYIAEFVIRQDLYLDPLECQIEHVRDIKGNWHNIHNLPDNLITARKINLRNTNVSKLPSNMEVGGDLDIVDTEIEALPDGLHVVGDISAENSKIKHMGEGVRVRGSLYLNNSNLDALPNDLKVDGNLSIRRTNVECLPAGLEVGYSIHISQTNITSLPDGMVVKGNLELIDVPLIKLPKSLVVEQNLIIGGSTPNDLPDDLVVKRDLFLAKEIKHFPDTVHVGGIIVYGSERFTVEEFKAHINKGELKNTGFDPSWKLGSI
jgi:hypothetical protein